jgi:cell fate regulator YaaT (PSP1 superfamily)
MENTIVVRLRDSGQTYFYKATNLNVKIGDYVILEHDRGLDYGQIVSPEDTSADNKSNEPIKKIIRVATENDLKQIVDNRAKSREAFNSCLKKIDEHKLDMKLVRAE